MIQIGTSGYSYDDWKGFFYPASCTQDAFLTYYASHFSTVELNFSYYRMPTAAQLESMVKRTDGKVTFAVKAHRSFTHERTAGDGDVNAFNEALSPLQDAGCHGATLLQFPHSFKQTQENRYYLRHICERIPLPVVEFRAEEWSQPSVWEWLKKIDVGFCCVDEPRIQGLMPPVAVATSNIAYVRFHGRNAKQWYHHNQPHERYNYQYSQSELIPWATDIRKLEKQADRTLVFFNNHFEAKAVDGAKKLASLLERTTRSEETR